MSAADERVRRLNSSGVIRGTEHLSSQPDVLRTETVIILETIKETSALGLPERAARPPEREGS